MKIAAGAAASARDTAKKKVDDLKGEMDRFRKMVEEIGGAERQPTYIENLTNFWERPGFNENLCGRPSETLSGWPTIPCRTCPTAI